MRRFIIGLLLTAGCAGSGSGTVGYHGSGAVYGSSYDSYGSPDLVYVSPGVQVIADYNEPIFYTDGLYWRYYNGVWYQSRMYTGGWAYASPPRSLLRIDRPYAYVRYRPRGYVSRRPTYRDDRRPVYRDNRPVYRDQSRPDYRYRQEQPQHPATRPPRPTEYLRDAGERRAEPPREERRREDARERRGDHDDRDDVEVRDHRRR